MRIWLWIIVEDAASHYQIPFMRFILSSIGVVSTVFMVCNHVDQLRFATEEKAFLKWHDKHIDNKLIKLIKAE